jgi:YD repeat-containing protein
VQNAAGENEMTSLTDSKVGVVTFERSAPNKVVRMVDPAGRSHRYGYTTDSFGNVVLATYTDPAGKITRYGYEGRAVLKTLTAPDGTVTTFGSDADQRVTSLTRNGQTWTCDYTTPWRTTVTDPQGNATTHRFDRRGRITSSSGPPYAPTNVRAVPGDAQAALSWAAATANGSPVTGYTITASPGGATKTVAGDVTSTMFDGLTNDTAYTFTAVATNAIGDSVASAPSKEVTPRSDPSLLAPLVAPKNVVATPGDTQARVSWTEPTLSLPLLTTYTVTTYRAADGAELGTTAAGSDSEVTVTGLKNGTPVYFTVTARTLLLSATSEPSNTVTPAGPPFAPTDVVAKRGDRQVEVSWQPPGPRPDGTPGDNGAPITSYTVTAYRAHDNARVSTTTNVSASPVTVGSLTNGTAYYFTVQASNRVGAGQESARSNVVIPAGRPFAPTNVTASAGPQPGEARVTWSPPPVQPDGTAGDNGDPIVSYTVRTHPGGATTTVGGDTTSTVVSGLRGDTYTFTVTAANGVGDSPESAHSNSVTVTSPPDPPTGVSASSVGDTVTVSWSAPTRLNGSTLTGYIVTGTPLAGPGSEVTTTVHDPLVTSTVFTGLPGGTTYEFRVVATSDLGNSEPSAPSNSVTTESAPGAPTDVRAVPGDRRVQLSWTGPSDLNGSQITGYEISVEPACSPPCTGLTVVGADTTSTVVENGLTNTTSYSFRVRAKSTAGFGPYSAAVDAIPHRPTHVAMGDSYSSGVGAEDVNNNDDIGGEHEMCQRADEAYGPVYHELQSAEADLVFLACGGAVTGHPNSPAEDTEGLSAIQKLLGEGGQIARMPGYAELVTLTIGGNDIGFTDVLFDCFLRVEQECDEQYRSGGPQDVAARINAMRAVLTDVYQAIRGRAPEARIAVLTYPQIITETDNCFEQTNYVPSGIKLSDEEKIWIRGRTADLAGVTLDAITDTGDSRIVPVDELGRFADDGHGVCAEPDSERYVNGAVPSDLGESFHPTVPGYQREAQDLLAKIGPVA